jgi:hypothetical protein
MVQQLAGASANNTHICSMASASCRLRTGTPHIVHQRILRDQNVLTSMSAFPTQSYSAVASTTWMLPLS